MLEDSDLRDIRQIVREEVRKIVQEELRTIVDEQGLKYALSSLEDRIVKRVQS